MCWTQFQLVTHLLSNWLGECTHVFKSVSRPLDRLKALSHLPEYTIICIPNVSEFLDDFGREAYRVQTAPQHRSAGGIPSGILERMELIFEIRDAEEGGFYARALGHSIFTEGDTWEELRSKILEAVSLHFEDAPSRPRLVQMHYVKDELIPVEAA